MLERAVSTPSSGITIVCLCQCRFDAAYYYYLSQLGGVHARTCPAKRSVLVCLRPQPVFALLATCLWYLISAHTMQGRTGRGYLYMHTGLPAI